MYDLVATILRNNNLDRPDYVEPYAGGCGLALSLLFGGHVSDIHLNDLDPSIWSFWTSVLNDTDRLVSLVEKTPITPAEWQRQKTINKAGDTADPLKLGFSTFFLNRTNRSGVIKGAGMIGGTAQDGNYKLNCRFNREDLARRIRRVAKYRNRIHFSTIDAIPFIKKMSEMLPKQSFFCIDPPYYNKGSSLYTNFYGPAEHSAVAKTILGLQQPWIVTYDYTNEIQMLYSKRRQFLFDINYSIQTKRVGSELLIASKRLRLPEYVKSQEIGLISQQVA